MLTTLHLKNYVLIDSLDIDFPGGLVIITGQTGAGKSILLGALSLLLGSKADASVISQGAESCMVEAEFDLGNDDEQLRQIMEENDIDWNEGHLIIRRVVNISGRSRSFINDLPVQIALLSSISSRLIDIHSQHQSLLLTDKNYQLTALDSFAGCKAQRASCAEALKKLQALRGEFSELKARLEKMQGERDYNEAQYAQLEQAGLRDGEVEEMEAEQRQLANAELIKENLCSVESLLSPQSEGMMPVAMAMKEASKLLQRVSSYVETAGELARRLDESRIELEDIASEVEAVNEGLEVSPQRLEMVEDRLSLLYDLMKKHDCKDIASLIELRDSLSDLLYDSTALEDKLEALKTEISAAEAELMKIADDLHKARMEAAPHLAKRLTDSLRFLELDRAVFEINLERGEVGSNGYDVVSFLFSSVGDRPVDVSKCASGGEISRIMLCLKDVMAESTNMPTMFFDEIDTGVSGSAADKMGSMICGMGENMQVFAITHLPQVAAKGAAHYVVSKTESEGRTLSSIKRINSEERVLEVARLLSGQTVTAAAIENAKSLLQ